MGLVDKLFRKNKQSDFVELKDSVDNVELEEIPEFINGQIELFNEEILDTDSKINQAKLKHNLEVIIEKVKRDNKLSNFMLIREDDYFPYGYEWLVGSKNTTLEKNCLGLSTAIKKRFALEQAGLIKDNSTGFSVPISDEDEMDALSKVDKYLASVLLPVKFRSTKHFTINTPLGVTGNYNSVSADRNFIILDGIDNFLNSGYGYSVAYHDAYLDMTHESLKISSNAIVMMEENKYNKLIQEEPKLIEELKERKLILFRGDETVAIDMVLTELGVLPSRVGLKYAYYDNQVQEIIDRSIEQLAYDNNLHFDKSHGGALTKNGGHFSNYYDEQNEDYHKSINEFISFMQNKFVDNANLFTYNNITNSDFANEIVEKIGVNNLINAINEFNQLALIDIKEKINNYKEDRNNITPEISNIFKTTLNMIDYYYDNELQIENNNELEKNIKEFLQADTVNEQLTAANKVVFLLQNSNYINNVNEIDESKEDIGTYNR